MTFNTLPKFDGAFFKRLSLICCGSLMILAIAAPLPAVDMLYVTMHNGPIISYDTTGNDGIAIANSVSIFANTNLSYPSGLAIDPSGNLFVANYSGSSITKFNSSGEYVSNITSNLNGPFTIAIDSSGNIYATNLGNNTINKFDSTGGYISSMNWNVNYIYGITIDSSDNIYVANNSSNSISKFNNLDEYVSSITTNLSGPIGLAIDSSGNLYAANSFNNTISKFDPSGLYQPMGLIDSTHLYAPGGLAIDSSGNLYATNSNNTISKFDSSGTFLTSWSTGTASPRFIAFKPVTVPEPSTFILAAIAAGVMAYLALRRKARIA